MEKNMSMLAALQALIIKFYGTIRLLLLLYWRKSCIFFPFFFSIYSKNIKKKSSVKKSWLRRIVSCLFTHVIIQNACYTLDYGQILLKLYDNSCDHFHPSTHDISTSFPTFWLLLLGSASVYDDELSILSPMKLPPSPPPLPPWNSIPMIIVRISRPPSPSFISSRFCTLPKAWIEKAAPLRSRFLKKKQGVISLSGRNFWRSQKMQGWDEVSIELKC